MDPVPAECGVQNCILKADDLFVFGYGRGANVSFCWVSRTQGELVGSLPLETLAYKEASRHPVIPDYFHQTGNIYSFRIFA
jgi:hypothetical protein